MEQQIAILMADLSGYTALTETHGPASAADLVDKYLEIVQKSLAGSAHLQERAGDEVMIVAESSADLLATAAGLLQFTAEHHFLQLHGGMHYGKVLYRNNSFYGTAVNLTSRIAAKAGAGSVWCSKDFFDSLPGDYTALFQYRGSHSFKNLSLPTPLFELVPNHSKSFFIDPVCRMLIDKEKTAVPHPVSDDIFFCSPVCRDIYLSGQASE